MTVDLPWPPTPLKPNARAHWAVKARAAASYRRDCCFVAQAAGLRALRWPAASVSLVFHPPSRRRCDIDNMLAAAKSGLDGVADATMTDDSTWSLTISRGEPVKGGRITLTMERQQ